MLNKWLQLFVVHFWISTKVGSAVWLLHGCCHMKLLPSGHVLSTPYNHAPCYITSCKAIISCHFMQSHICRVHACLAVTCHLHFCQNDGDLLCPAVITWRWNWYWNKSQHKKLTLEKTSPVAPAGTWVCDLLIRSWVGALTTELSLPQCKMYDGVEWNDVADCQKCSQTKERLQQSCIAIRLFGAQT